MIAAVGWLRGLCLGPVTGRTEGPQSRDVALCELCAAESQLADQRHPPPLHEVCQLLEVSYREPPEVDSGYALGVWLTLRWALGETQSPPLDLPIRRPDGSLAGEAEIYARLVEGGQDHEAAQESASVLATASRRLAVMVEDIARTIRS
jgi:hypothetical protein